MRKLIPKLVAISILLVITGCVAPRKTEPSLMVANASVSSVSWVWKIIPGYRQRTRSRLDFNIDVQEKKLELDRLRNDRRDEWLRYNKIAVVTKKKKDEK